MFAKEDMSAKNHSQAMWKRECVSVYRTFRVRTRRPGNPGFSCSFHIPYGIKNRHGILKDGMPVYALL